jgi:hypothetical protein
LRIDLSWPALYHEPVSLQRTGRKKDALMNTMQPGVIAVIPARWQPSRFPGKPLALIAGKTCLTAFAGKIHEQTI